MPDNICRVPVTATYSVSKGGGEPIMTSAEYVDIPADAIARFLIEHYGADAIFGEEAGA